MTYSKKDVAQIYADALNKDIKIKSLGRTILDTIEALKYHPESFTSNGKGNARWLNRANLRMKSNRPYILKLQMSPAVKKIYAKAGEENLPQKVNLICEHVVPCNVILKGLDEMKIKKQVISATDILHVHEKFYRRCIITKDEDEILRKEKYNSKMPENWDEKDIYARYKAVGFTWANAFT